MGYDKYGPSLHQGIHAFFDKLFRPGIDGAGGFIQNQHRRVGNCRSGNGKQLSLALGKIGAVAVKHGLITLGKPSDKGIRIGDAGCFLYFFIRCLQSAIADIIGNGPGKQVGILDYHGQGTAQILFADIPDIQAVVGDGAALDLIKTVDQVDNRRLSRACGAYKGYFLAGLCIQADAV